MDEKTRQNVGGLCIGLAAVIIGGLARLTTDGEGFAGFLGAAALAIGALILLVCLVNLGLDLLGRRR